MLDLTYPPSLPERNTRHNWGCHPECVLFCVLFSEALLRSCYRKDHTVKNKFRAVVVIATLALSALPFAASAASYQYEDLTANISAPTQVHVTSTQQPPSDDCGNGKPIKS